MLPGKCRFINFNCFHFLILKFVAVWYFYVWYFTDPIKILIRPENSYLIDRESVISLAVDASTDPALSLQYRWRFRNSNNQTTVLTSNTNPRAWTLSDSNRNLTINAQGLNKDEFFQLIGRYFVEIYHQYDAEFVHIDVVTDIPASK